jgi:hypothetical protein
MTDPTRINPETSLIEELEAYRARLEWLESGKSRNQESGPERVARLKRIIADLETKLASSPKE